MHHRVGLAFALVSTLLFPVVASAQTAPPVWLGPPRPPSPQAYPQPTYPQAHAQTAYPQPYAQPAYPRTYVQPAYPQAQAQPRYPQNYAQPSYPQAYAQPVYPQAYARPVYPQAYYRPAYAAPAYSSAPMVAPAAYGYPTYPGYGNSSSTPNYAQGNQVAAGSWGASREEAAGPLVETKDRLHYIEMGMGAFVPTDQGNAPKLGLEASLWAIHGGWVPNSGLYLTLDASTGFDLGCMAKRATDGCKAHLRIHWIGTGPFFNTGTPMIVKDVPRPWDLMALTGAEVRLWKGLTAKATINWFLPSPWGVYEHEKQRAESNLNGVAAAPATAAAGIASGETQVADPLDDVQSIFGHALKHPQLNLMAMWEF
jgi:hypothetical protein